jgi:hypothetical protein
MQVLHPTPPDFDDPYHVVTIIDFGQHDGQPFAFREEPMMHENVQYIRETGSLQPRRSQGYRLTMSECCHVTLANGITALGRKRGLNVYLANHGQLPLIELEPARAEF